MKKLIKKIKYKILNIKNMEENIVINETPKHIYYDFSYPTINYSKYSEYWGVITGGSTPSFIKYI